MGTSWQAGLGRSWPWPGSSRADRRTSRWLWGPTRTRPGCPTERATYEADVGVALADAGLAQEARQRVAANLDRWPADFWVRMHAGDALVLLDDRDGAELHFHEALDLADEADDFEGRADAVERLAELERSRRRRR